jgi:NAD(P)H dehydrogenase (quinone)
MFAIVGATGKVGFSTAATLRHAGHHVRAIMRDSTKAGPLRAIGCEVAEADLQHPGDLVQAISGAHAVQIICPPRSQAQDMVGDMHQSIDSLIETLERVQPELVVAISDYGAHVEYDVGMPSVFRSFEGRLRELSIRKVILRSAEHMEGWEPLIPVAIATGTLPSLHHPLDIPFPTISAHDLGMISADLMLRPRLINGEQLVHAEGPERYCANDVAAALSRLLSKTVTAVELPRDAWQQTLEGILSPSGARLLVNLYDAHNRGQIDVEPDAGEIRYGTSALGDALLPLLDVQ